jgi:phenylpyruvate tautomerase PptA (4-oxalocrotonate tautomerase family)
MKAVGGWPRAARGPTWSPGGSLRGVSTVHDVALARIEILEGRSPEERRQLVDVVAMALSDALQTPPADPSVRLLEYPRSQFLVPYPDRHSDQFTLVEVTMFCGRSMETKRRLYQAIVDGLTASDVPRDDILIVLHEPPMRDWAVNGGVPASEVDVGFKVDI